MSYEIYYKRAFIKVGAKYIPVLQHGSNNCWETSWKGRDIPEKYWSNWIHTKEGRGPIIATRDEITRYAVEFCDTTNYGGDLPFKARGRQFGSSMEAMRWFDNGVKTARTVEEYSELGNTVHVRTYVGNGESKTYPVKTSAELLSMLEVLKNDNPWVGFSSRELLLPKPTRVTRPKKEVDSFWTVYVEGYGYLKKRTARRIFQTGSPQYAKKFKTANQAQKVMEALAPKYKDIEFSARLVKEKAVL